MSQSPPHQPSSWTSLKGELCDRGLLPSLFRGSPDDVAFQAVVSDQMEYPIVVSAYQKDETIEHHPLFFDTHLRDIGALLDRIISYRREARELEILAVKAATDYLLFKQQSEIDFAIDTHRLRRNQKEQERTTHADAAQFFGTASDLNRGFRRISEGRSNQMQSEVEDIDVEVRLLNEKKLLMDRYHGNYRARHQEPGNAHNYEERALRVFGLMAEDLREAYAKATAVAIGFELVYGRPPDPLPEQKPLEFVDKLIVWCRRAIRAIELEAEREIEYDLVIPLVQPNTFTGSSLVSHAEFERSLKSTSDGNTSMQLTFILPDIYFGDQNVRLRGVGLSFGNVTDIVPSSGLDRNATADSYVRLCALINTPEQKHSRTGRVIHHLPLRFGNVTALSWGGPLAYTDRPECQNGNPIGRWSIELRPLMVYKDTRLRSLQEGVDGNALQDLKLHLRVRARPRDS